MHHQRQSFRTDENTATALRRLAIAENKGVSEVLREAVRLRLEVGALSNVVRIAIGDATSQAVAHAQARIDELGRAWNERFIESETRERETTRQDISDFLSALSAIVAQSEQPASASAIQKPTTKTLREQLAK
jgi:hypothetical protein